MLLEEIKNYGAIDVNCQEFIILCMALTDEDINLVRLGELSKRAVEAMRVIKVFINVTF